MEKLQSSQQHGALHVLYNQRCHVHRLESVYAVLPWQIARQLEQRPIQWDQNILESFYVKQQNHPQINNMIEDWEEGEAMRVHEDYWNHPYQPSTLTRDQQQQIEEGLALMTRKGVYSYEYMNSLNDSKNHSYHPKTTSTAH